MTEKTGANSTQKPRLLIVTNTLYSFGGGERLAVNIAAGIKQEFDITIVSPVSKLDPIKASRDTIMAEVGMQGIEIVDLRAFGFRRKAFGAEPYVLRFLYPGSILRMARLIAHTDSIYQISMNPPMLVLTMALSRLFRKRMVFGVHNFSISKAAEKPPSAAGRVWNAIFMSLIGCSSAFHVTNTRDLNLLSARFPKKEVALIPNFVTTQFPEPKNNTDSFICLYVGRLERVQKGIDFLVEIIKSVLSKNSGIKFEIAGAGGESEEDISKLSKSFPDRVNWLGFVTGKALDDAYNRASLQILTSRNEAFGLVLLEGQCRGLPVMSFDIPGPHDFVKKDFQGALIPAFDTKAFAQKIMDFYAQWESDKGAYAALKVKIFDSTEEYSASNILPKIIALIKGTAKKESHKL